MKKNIYISKLFSIFGVQSQIFNNAIHSKTRKNQADSQKGASPLSSNNALHSICDCSELSVFFNHNLFTMQSQIDSTTTLCNGVVTSLNLRLVVRKAMILKTYFGFFQEYFYRLPYHNTKEAAFNELNVEYYNYFGEFKFNSFEDFRATFKTKEDAS